MGEEEHQVGIGQAAIACQQPAQVPVAALEAVGDVDQQGLGVFTLAHGLVGPWQHPAQRPRQRRHGDGCDRLGSVVRAQAGRQCGLHGDDQFFRGVGPGLFPQAQLAVAAVAVALEKVVEQRAGRARLGAAQPGERLGGGGFAKAPGAVRHTGDMVDHAVQLRHQQVVARL